MTAILLSTDLLFSSRLEHAAARLGFRLSVAATAERACELARGGGAGLLIVDLTLPGLLLDRLLEDWLADPSAPPVVAYGPHVATGTLETARRAGCAEVLTRGQFDREMGQVLARYLNSPPDAGAR